MCTCVIHMLIMYISFLISKIKSLPFFELASKVINTTFLNSSNSFKKNVLFDPYHLDLSREKLIKITSNCSNHEKFIK